ncbi:hypothetical protein HX065_10410 [Myroides odoratimimus]|uniref:reverse transcriptase domain-containing protein n=1 Tax=Myroides odoratimimus TaxID=76832 RepID=UPI002574FFB4|nr:reverse transcriptase domain-containing protein [Myroides odoratimimus]MDM1036028.1 hypothetical protein [Myroides odoratimimus]MDM1460456.1 hypothetical protein [Myroides odoratimimus]
MKKPDWIKAKGYIHITPTLDIRNDWKKLYYKITDKEYIASYAFFPLIYAEIKERKYKKINKEEHTNNTLSGRTHLLRKNDNTVKKTRKIRPLHYASHFDSLVYGYYADVLSTKYQTILDGNKDLDESVIAYRKIKIDDTSDIGKSTIHFAKEAFDEIINRAKLDNGIAALTFDIESFFSGLNHQFLYKKWCEVMQVSKLPKDHLNVFKASTNFRYILRDDLRIRQVVGKRRVGFDERKLFKIRRDKGYKCFFRDNKDFREHIKQGKLRVYKNPFFKLDKDLNKKVNIGIPQGLPISTILANLYLLDFDRKLIDKLVKGKGAYYRRYSDDILIVCSIADINEIKEFVIEEIKNSFLGISEAKTEQFIFQDLEFDSEGNRRLTSIKVDGKELKVNKPLIYLGFEFRGYNTIIKSTNLARYYRRLLSVVKRRARRANNNYGKSPFAKRAVYLNQIKKLYNAPLKLEDGEHADLKQRNRTRYRFEKNELGQYELVLFSSSQNKNSNYITYLKRCDKIFEKNGENSFLRQLRKRKSIVNHSVRKHLDKR